jgi:peptide/nickel transport system permease protein
LASYLLKRTLYGLLVLWGVVSLVFFLFNVLPGDPARMMLGQRADMMSVEMIRKDLGMDRSAGMQYIKYLNDLSPVSFHSDKPESYFYFDKEQYSSLSRTIHISGDKLLAFKPPYLRRSYQSRKPVLSIISETIPNTFILAITAMFFASLAGIFLGTLAALNKNSFFDRFSLILAASGMSLPSFFAAILIGWIFAFVLGDLTGLNLTGNLYVIDDFGDGTRLQMKNLILPAFTLGIRPLAIILQLTRNSVLEVLSQDYIRTARAKGLSTPHIIRKHVLRNAMNPVLTAVSGWFATLMAGVIFIEYIFGWKGLGFVIVDSLNHYDLPVVMGSVLTISLLFVIINILVDLSYSWLDPRVRLYS